MKKDKPIAIYQDQRIAEEFCNFKCEYCEGFYPTEFSLKKDKYGNLHVPREWFEKIAKYPFRIKKYFHSGRSFKEFYDIALAIMEESKKVMDTDVLKISGGELTINPDLSGFVEKVHSNYPMVQILSNGSNIRKEDIEKYKKMGNVSFQISLDGVSPEANYSKTHSAGMTKKVISNVDALLENGIGVEINCVLTKYNTDKFHEFLEHFKGAKNLMIVPRPVRGEPRGVLDFTKEQLIIMKDCISANYDEYSDILPPIEYFDRLFNIMESGQRSNSCYIPYFIQSIDGYGEYEKCPIGLLYEEDKNILNNSVNSNDILINSSYNIDNKYDSCNYCIIQYEMLNLFVEGLITEEELKKMPSLNNDLIISHINNIKHDIIEKNGAIKNERDLGGKVLLKNK